MKKVGRALLTALIALAGAACDPDIPFAPTYANDVRPLFMAQCVRCHGAGDMLRVDPALQPAGRKPALCYLDRLEDLGPGCTSTPADPTMCQQGTASAVCMAFLNSYFPANMPKRTDAARMPPPPAEMLNDWEHEVIVRWLANPLP